MQDDDLDSSDDREEWLRMAPTRAAQRAVMASRDAALTKLKQAAATSTDPKVQAAYAEFVAFSAMLKAGLLGPKEEPRRDA